jgi:hypothetical protein
MLDSYLLLISDVEVADLVKVDCGLPVVVFKQVEVSHTDLAEVTVAMLASQMVMLPRR